MFRFLVLFAFLFSLEVFAAPGVVGNGGDLVVCRDPNGAILSTELLDFYEARVDRDENIALDPNQSYENILNAMLERVRAKDFVAHQRYAARVANFNNEARFLPNTELIDIPDSGHLSFPRGCKVEQFAIQKKPELPGQRQYTISKDLWDVASPLTRAGLVFHEVIYRDLIESDLDQIDSIHVRYFNSSISANKIGNLTDQAYIELLTKLGVLQVGVEGFASKMSSIQFHPNGQVRTVESQIVGNHPSQVPLTPSLTVTVWGNFWRHFSLSSSGSPRVVEKFKGCMGDHEFPLQGVLIGLHCGTINLVDSQVVEISTIEDDRFTGNVLYFKNATMAGQVHCGRIVPNSAGFVCDHLQTKNLASLSSAGPAHPFLTFHLKGEFNPDGVPTHVDIYGAKSESGSHDIVASDLTLSYRTSGMLSEITCVKGPVDGALAPCAGLPIYLPGTAVHDSTSVTESFPRLQLHSNLTAYFSEQGLLTHYSHSVPVTGFYHPNIEFDFKYLHVLVPPVGGDFEDHARYTRLLAWNRCTRGNSPAAFSFHPNGTLKTGLFSDVVTTTNRGYERVEFLKADGSKIWVVRGELVTFDENGYLVSKSGQACPE